MEYYEPRNIPNRRLIGYETQKKVLYAMGLKTAIEGGDKRALLFGYPGVGKSIAPYDTACTLNNKYGCRFSLLHIRCEELIELRDLKDLYRYVEESEQLIVVFDEMEALAPPIEEISAERARVVHACRRFFDQQHEKTLMIAITNYLPRIERSIFRKFSGYPIYFPPTSDEILAELIKENLGVSIEIAEKTVRIMLRECSDMGLKPMGDHVVRACKSIRGRSYSKDNPEELAKQLLGAMPAPPLEEDVARYKSRYRPLILYFERHTSSFWLEELKRLEERLQAAGA